MTRCPFYIGVKIKTTMTNDKLNERLQKIARKRSELDKQKLKAELTKKETIEKYKRDIKALAPRIADLMMIAHSLQQNDLNLGRVYDDHGVKYDEFVTEGIHHRLGFYSQNGPYATIALGVGIEGGGGCGKDLVVNDEGELIKSPIAERSFNLDKDYQDFCDKCDNFLTGFDDFEKRVYEYVDNL